VRVRLPPRAPPLKRGEKRPGNPRHASPPCRKRFPTATSSNSASRPASSGPAPWPPAPSSASTTASIFGRYPGGDRRALAAIGNDFTGENRTAMVPGTCRPFQGYERLRCSSGDLPQIFAGALFDGRPGHPAGFVFKEFGKNFTQRDAGSVGMCAASRPAGASRGGLRQSSSAD
jgi:hypothetical protein